MSQSIPLSPQIDGQSAARTFGNPAEPGGGPASVATPALCDELLGLLEDKAGARDFLEAYGATQKRFAGKRERRKRQRAAEAVTDPAAAAQRRMERSQAKKFQVLVPLSMSQRSFLFKSFWREGKNGSHFEPPR